MYSPIGIRFIDDFTTQLPFGYVRPRLEIADAQGVFGDTDIAGVSTASGVLTYPGLGRRRDAKSGQPRRYRVSVDAEFYTPRYLAVQTYGTPAGIVFNAYPYDDETPPASPPPLVDVPLLPASHYPFGSHVRVLHGIVADAAQAPVAHAFVSMGLKEHVYTDARGAFSLPLRWVKTTATIDAHDDAGRVGSIAVDVSKVDQLYHGHTIVIH
jgi:hypothetical protein